MAVKLDSADKKHFLQQQQKNSGNIILVSRDFPSAAKKCGYFVNYAINNFSVHDVKSCTKMYLFLRHSRNKKHHIEIKVQTKIFLKIRDYTNWYISFLHP